MGALRAVVGSNLRRRWRWLLAMALVVGLAAGFSLTAAVGARRAVTAFDRLAARTLAPHVIVNVPQEFDPDGPEPVDAMPGVEAAGRFAYTPVAPEGLEPGVEAGGFALLDNPIGTSVYRPLAVEGRLWHAGRSDEVTVNEPLADAAGIAPGDTIKLTAGSEDGKTHSLGEARVVGVHRGTFDVGANGRQPSMLLPPDFVRTHREQLAIGGGATVARIRGGEAALPALNRRLQETLGDGAFVIPASLDTESTRHGLRVQAAGFALLAIVSLAATVMAGAQALRRYADAERADLAVLGALGAGTRTRRAITAVPLLLAIAVSIAIGAALALVASPLAMFGVGRAVDPDPGIHAEGWVIGSGAAVTLVILTAAVAGTLWRVSAADDQPGAPPRSAGAPPLRIGLLPLLGAGPRRVVSATRAAIIGTTVGVAGIVAVVVVATSLGRIADNPRAHGWTFDAALSSERALPDALRETLGSDRDVSEVVWGSVAPVLVGGVGLEVLGLDRPGRLHPTLLGGRAPEGRDEIALAPAALRTLKTHVGGSITVTTPSGPQRLRVVGKAAYPGLGAGGDPDTTASMTRGGLDALGIEPYQTIALMDLAPDADRARIAGLVRGADAELIEPYMSAKVRNLEGVGALPALLVGFLALLATTGVGHSLVVSARSRRREFAILRTLGFVTRQSRAAVFWQASATVAIGAVAGLLLGAALGRQAWRMIADSAGILNHPAVAAATIALIAVATVALANLLAVIPSRIVGRLRPAVVLRTE